MSKKAEDFIKQYKDGSIPPTEQLVDMLEGFAERAFNAGRTKDSRHHLYSGEWKLEYKDFEDWLTPTK